MSSDSVVLIADMLVPVICTGTDIAVHVFDITMMTMGAKEQIEKYFEEILTESGLKLAKLWRAAAGPLAIIEAHLAA